MATSNGNCFICGKTAGKTAIKNHILKEHTGSGETCYLFKAEGAHAKSYWLFFTIPLNSSLSVVDKFLREIWCECCGHLSAFYMDGNELKNSRKISELAVGDILLYEYDFGSTTEILLTVLKQVERTKQQKSVQLLARNAPMLINCDKCGAPAEYIDFIEEVQLCDECFENSEDELEMLMPIANSPRCGVCGYDGNLDIWTFNPNKPFPQPPKAKERRRGI